MMGFRRCYHLFTRITSYDILDTLIDCFLKLDLFGTRETYRRTSNAFNKVFTAHRVRPTRQALESNYTLLSIDQEIGP